MGRKEKDKIYKLLWKVPVPVFEHRHQCEDVFIGRYPQTSVGKDGKERRENKSCNALCNSHIEPALDFSLINQRPLQPVK